MEQGGSINPKENWNALPKIDAEFDPESIDVRARVAEILEEYHAEIIEYLKKNLHAEKRAGLSTSLSEKLITEFEFRYSLASKYSINIIAEFFTERQKKYHSARTFDRAIEYCLDTLYGSPQGDQSLFSKISREIGGGPKSRVGRSILKSLGVPADGSDWEKSVNACDMRDLQREMLSYMEENDWMRNIYSNVFERFSEQIKGYLAGADLSSIREIIKDMIEPKFREAYEKVTADTLERRKERILFVLIENAKAEFSTHEFHKLIMEHLGLAYLPKRIITFSLTPEESNKANELIGRLGSLKHKRETAEAFLEKYGERLVTKVGANYEIVNPQEFKELIQQQYDKELDEVAREVIAGRVSQKYAAQQERTSQNQPPADR